MSASAPLDSLGRRRSPAAMPGYLAGRPPRSKGRYPPDPPRTEEMNRGHALLRRRVTRRSRPRADRGALARRTAYPGGARSDRARPRPATQVDARATRQRRTPSRGRDGRLGFRATGTRAASARDDAGWSAKPGVRRRCSPHQLRHAHALELLREGVPLNVIQRQLGHRNLGVTPINLQGIEPYEIIETVHARRPPMTPASMGLALPRAR
jgi:hypothetical protein